MTSIDIDELTSLAITLASETVGAVRGLLERSKIGVRNKEELESFDLQVLPEVMKDMATYLTSTFPRSDVPISIRADAYRAALALQKSAPRLFEKQIMTFDKWVDTARDHSKLLKKQEDEQLVQEQKLDWAISAKRSDEASLFAANFMKKAQEQGKERAQIKLNIDKETYQLFLKNQLMRLTKDANRILVASQYLFNEPPQAPTSLTVKPKQTP